MKKLASNFTNMVLVLTGITILSGLALASVYSLTKGPIDSSRKNKQLEAIQAVLPPFDHIDEKPIEINDGVETTKVFKAYNKKNVFVGAAVQSSSNNGYKGHIDVIVGFNKDGVIVNYSILGQNETPGLGSRMLDWFKTNTNHQNIIGKNPATSNLTVSKDGGEVDGITASTISSRAFLFAVRNAYFAFSTNLEKQQEVEAMVENDSVQSNITDTIQNNTTEMKGQQQ